MSKNIVSNTGPLITLEKLDDGYGFIRKLYHRIIVPHKVLEEVSQQIGTPQDYLQKYHIEDFVEVRDVKNIAAIPDIHLLDDGEIMAISLAIELKLELLIEEVKGRKIATFAGLRVSGIAGQIGRACRQGLIEKVEALHKLQQLLNVGHINREVYTSMLKIL